MSKMIYTISDVSGLEGQKRLDHYNKWLMDPKRVPGTVYPGYPEDKKLKVRKKGKMMQAVVETVAAPKTSRTVKTEKAQKPVKSARAGTKLAQATDIVKATGKHDKEACLKAIVEALGVTRGNASIYYAKALVKLG